MVTLAVSLELAVNSVQKRCMIVYSTSEDDHLKIDIKFPKIEHKGTQNKYSVELSNTENGEVENWSI